jgi:hypothetical protein
MFNLLEFNGFDPLRIASTRHSLGLPALIDSHFFWTTEVSSWISETSLSRSPFGGCGVEEAAVNACTFKRKVSLLPL